MSRSKFLLAAFVAAVAALVAPATSQAAFTVFVTDGTNSFTFDDTGAGANGDGGSGANDGQISGFHDFALASGGTIRISINANTNAPGSAGEAQITTQTTEIRRVGTGSTGAATITITTLSSGDDDDFTLNPTNGTLTTKLQATTLKGSSASGISSISGSDVAASAVSVTTPTSATSTTQVSYSNPFSFGSKIVVNLDASSGTGTETLGQIQIDSTINAAPAPVGLVMLATALPFAGLLRRRLRKSEVATVA